MGLKQSIVIKNEFTNNVRSAPGRGTRGGSPGQYVTRYMARGDATEVLAPVAGYDALEFSRYMARSSATELLKQKEDSLVKGQTDAHGSPLVLKARFRKSEQLGGRAFGSRGLSLSHDDIMESSEAIQEAFNQGHSVQKVILSFTEDYLKENGVIDKNFKHKGRGSYRGYVDQLKMRRAITSGVNALFKAGQYADPEWVGSLQMDTSHVHAHLAIVDKAFSDKRLAPDGSDRGKLNEVEKKMMRKGVHNELADLKALKVYNQQLSIERQNVTSYVKDYAYDAIYDNTSIRLLTASLPKNRNHWRYGTNREDMKYSNKLARQIVEDVFEREPEASGYDRSIQALNDYVDESARTYDLNDEAKADLYNKGRAAIVERSVNGLYKTIGDIDDREFFVRTPMTDIQSASDDVLKQAMYDGVSDNEDFDLIGFTLRVRGYHDREVSHSDKAIAFYDEIEEYDKALDAGLVDDRAHVMRLYYEEEMRYHMGLTDKYRSFLSYRHPVEQGATEDLTPRYEALVAQYEAIQQDEADAGTEDRDAREAYKKELEAYTVDCFKAGVATLQEWDGIVEYRVDEVKTNFVLPYRPKTSDENIDDAHFNKVKAYDVHHLGLDFYNSPDQSINQTNAMRFLNIYEQRSIKAADAKRYVEDTNQTHRLLDASIQDIESMEPTVRMAVEEGIIKQADLDAIPAFSERQLYTLPVDRTLDIETNIDNALVDYTPETYSDLPEDVQREVLDQVEKDAELG